MNDNVGQQLRQVREAQDLTLDQASHATHIRVYYLKAIESGELGLMPSAVQARGFIRAYAAYLGVSAEKMLAALDQEEAVVEPPVTAQPAATREEKSAQDESIDAIYVDIGQRLKSQREMLGLSLDEVERQTHLRQHYLKALESGDIDGLPSPVQGRGMLNNYAIFLGLDPEPLLLRFAQGLQAQLVARQATRPTPARTVRAESRPPSPLRRIFSAEMLLGAFIVVFLAGFAIWGAARIFAMRSDQSPPSTAPSIAEVLLSAPTATASPTSLPSTPTVPPLPAPTNPAEETPVFAVLPGETQGVQVYVTVRQRAWMRATVDGEVTFEGRVQPGSAYQFEGDETVEILTGNGAALQIFFNQQDLGPMGLFGQVVQQVYTLEGMQTPTPTVTATPTETPRVTPTPSATTTSP